MSGGGTRRRGQPARVSFVFDALEDRNTGHIIIWRRMKGRVNPPDMLTMKIQIDMEEPDWKRAVYKRIRAMSESLNGRVKRERTI